MNLDAKYKKWLQCGYNVLLEGRHGIGKTETIIKTFNEAGLKWKYFSCATLDPWVDFVGVPKEIHREGKNSCLGLIRPEEFEDDAIEAILFDEFSRAPAKVRNAVMELLQFKSINGRKFNNLKVIWAAINPYDDDGTYDVEQIDPAQYDRFEVHYKLPYKADETYFFDKYGSIGKIAVEWWNSLPEIHQAQVSPRRLDYAVDAYNNGVDLEDILPTDVRPKSLKTMIEMIGIELTHEEMWRKDPEMYINTLASRNDKCNVADAFDVLQQNCLDMAIDYVTKLPPNKLKLVACDPRTTHIVISAESSKSILTSLKFTSYSEIDRNEVLRSKLHDVVVMHPALAELILQTEKDRLRLEPWAALLRNLQQGVDESGAFVIMAAACTRLHDVPQNRWNSGNRLANEILRVVKYLFDFYRGVCGEMLKIDPVLIHKIVQHERVK